MKNNWNLFVLKEWFVPEKGIKYSKGIKKIIYIGVGKLLNGLAALSCHNCSQNIIRHPIQMISLTRNHGNVFHIVLLQIYRKIIYPTGQGLKYRLRKTKASLIWNHLLLSKSISTVCKHPINFEIETSFKTIRFIFNCEMLSHIRLLYCNALAQGYERKRQVYRGLYWREREGWRGMQG